MSNGAETALGSRLEAERDGLAVLGQGFAGAQLEGHAGPAAVVQLDSRATRRSGRPDLVDGHVYDRGERAAGQGQAVDLLRDDMTAGQARIFSPVITKRQQLRDRRVRACATCGVRPSPQSALSLILDHRALPPMFGKGR
jgi:hypothetical protein